MDKRAKKIQHPRKAAKLRKMGIPAPLAEILVRDALSTDEVVEAVGFKFAVHGYKLPYNDLTSQRERAVRRLANSLMMLANSL